MSKVTCIDTLGSDLTIVNAARVSFAKRKTTFDPKADFGLLKYLAKHKHYSPFRHVQMQFHIKCPEFVARQLYKHVVGIETTSTHPTKDHAWNEVSGRYVELHDYYEPSEWRQQSVSNKQASDGPIEDPMSQERANQLYAEHLKNTEKVYKELLDLGIAREQARIVLPLSFMTEFYWTVSFQAVMNFIQLRDASDAQGEIQDIAVQLRDIVKEKFPFAYDAWCLSGQ
jgi:thymidylate synthase (FAD)